MRSKWKISLINNLSRKNQGLIRSNHILLNDFNKKLFVYNGKFFVPISINKLNMVGFKLGEFSFTKKRCMPPQKKLRKKKK